MPVSMNDVLNYLGREEPPYQSAAQALGSDALPHLAALVRSNEPGLASKAVSLAGLIPGGRDIVALGLGHRALAVRIASAATIRNLGDDATPLLHAALTDPAPQVRKWGLKSVPPRPDGDLREAIEEIADEDPDRLLRAAARRLVGKGRATSD